MDILEAAGRARQDRRRDDPRPRLRRAAVPAGPRGQPHGRRLRAVGASCSTRTSWPGPTAATCSSSAAAPSSSTTPTTTTTRRPASATSTTRTADGPHPRAARPRVLRPGARRVRPGRAGLRRRRHVRRPARRRVHRRRDRPCRVPGRRRRVHARHPVLHRRGDRRRQHRARDRLGDEARGHPAGHVDRRAVRRDVRARRVPVQHDRGLRRATCGRSCSATCSRSAPRTSSRC